MGLLTDAVRLAWGEKEMCSRANSALLCPDRRSQEPVPGGLCGDQSIRPPLLSFETGEGWRRRVAPTFISIVSVMGHNFHVPYVRTIRRTIPCQIWEEKGGVSYSRNVAYLACLRGRGGGGAGVFFPIFQL